MRTSPTLYSTPCGPHLLYTLHHADLTYSILYTMRTSPTLYSTPYGPHLLYTLHHADLTYSILYTMRTSPTLYGVCVLYCVCYAECHIKYLSSPPPPPPHTHTFVACQTSSKCESPQQNSERNSIVLCSVKTQPHPSSWKRQWTDCAECLEGLDWINLNCNAFYFCKFSKIAPVGIPCVQWCHLYSGVICTVVSSVDCAYFDNSHMPIPSISVSCPSAQYKHTKSIIAHRVRRCSTYVQSV